MSTVGDLLAVAGDELGYVEKPPGSNDTKYGEWYGLNGQPWCGMFVSWCADAAGLDGIRFAYTPAGAATFKNEKRWLPQHSDDVRSGDVVFFYYPKHQRIAHTGWVQEVHPNGNLITIEGNTDERGGRTGGRVMRRLRSRRTVGEYGGFGRPLYDEDVAEVMDVYIKHPNGKIFQIVGEKRVKISSVNRWKKLVSLGARAIEVPANDPIWTEFPEQK